MKTMKFSNVFMLLLIVSLFVVGCTDAQSRYSSSSYNYPQAGGAPAPAAGGCGVAAPADAQDNLVVEISPTF